MAAFTKLSQMKVGMRVRCIFPRHNRTGKEGTVVKLHGQTPIEISWDDGSDQETEWAYARSFEPVDQIGIDWGVGQPTTTISQARQEKPCQTCGRNNDVGIKICWNCGNQPEYI